MGLLGVIQAALELAKPVIDIMAFNKIMAIVHEYEANEKAISDEKSHWPDWDDAKMSFMISERNRLKEAMTLQMSMAKVAKS